MKTVINFKVEIPREVEKRSVKSGRPSRTKLVRQASEAFARFCIRKEIHDEALLGEDLIGYKFDNGIRVSWDIESGEDFVPKFDLGLRNHSYGVELILRERWSQIMEKGYTPSHDHMHQDGELVDAAICYALGGERVINLHTSDGGEGHVKIKRHTFWPWDMEHFNPAAPPLEDNIDVGENIIQDTIRDLTKAGALIAAEIDRLNRVLKKNSGDKEEGREEKRYDPGNDR